MYKRCGLDPSLRKILWSMKWQLAPISLPGNFHGQRSQAATVRGVTKSRTRVSARVHTHTHTHTHTHFSTQQRQIIDAIGYIGAGRKLCNQVSPFYKWRNWGSIRWREWKHENRTGFTGWTACEHDSELGLRRNTYSEASNWKHSFFLSCLFLGI